MRAWAVYDAQNLIARPTVLYIVAGGEIALRRERTVGAQPLGADTVLRLAGEHRRTEVTAVEGGSERAKKRGVK